MIGLTTSTTELIWDPRVLAERNGRITNYTVVYRDINSQQELQNVTADTHLTLSGLKPDTTYDIKVRAHAPTKAPARSAPASSPDHACGARCAAGTWLRLGTSASLTH